MAQILGHARKLAKKITEPTGHVHVVYGPRVINGVSVSGDVVEWWGISPHFKPYRAGGRMTSAEKRAVKDSDWEHWMTIGMVDSR